MRYRKLRKLRHFIGRADHSLDAVFLNSMPKSGTNLLERFFISHGYLRNYHRSYNEHNVPSGILSSSLGRLDVGHLFNDEACHMGEHKTVFLIRPLWQCIYSYLNYMLIDSGHAASDFIRTSIKEKELLDCVRRLIFTSQNPLGRSLLSEYERFFSIDVNQYDLVITYDDFKSAHASTVSDLAEFLSRSSGEVSKNIEASLSADTWTRNQGRIDIFATIQPSFVAEIRLQVESADQFSVYFE